MGRDGVCHLVTADGPPAGETVQSGHSWLAVVTHSVSLELPGVCELELAGLTDKHLRPLRPLRPSFSRSLPLASGGGARHWVHLQDGGLGGTDLDDRVAHHGTPPAGGWRQE